MGPDIEYGLLNYQICAFMASVSANKNGQFDFHLLTATGERDPLLRHHEHEGLPLRRGQVGVDQGSRCHSKRQLANSLHNSKYKILGVRDVDATVDEVPVRAGAAPRPEVRRRRRKQKDRLLLPGRLRRV